MKTELISEKQYERTMKGRAEPWLDERRTVLWVKRKTGERICCERYLAQDPRGIVFISHGFKESAAKYAESAWYFLHEGYHVYIMEHCGHGRSYRLTEDPSLVHVDGYKRYLADMLAVARTARADADGRTEGAPLPMYLYGHSMGGGIGIAAAAADTGLFSRIVLSAPMIQPKTGAFPFPVTRAGSVLLCAAGRSEAYCPGNHPYRGPEDFATSASLSRPRFDYYQAIKAGSPLLQLSAASIGWVHAAVQLKDEIMNRSVKSADTPMILFQAERDGSVSVKAQNDFVRERNRCRPGSTFLVKIPGSKHEIYNSPDAAVSLLWEKLFDFINT